MKTQKEIEQMLKTEIERHNTYNKLFIAAIKRKDTQSIHNLFAECNSSTAKIILLKEILNHV